MKLKYLVGIENLIDNAGMDYNSYRQEALELYNKVQDFGTHSAKYKNAYFWTDLGNASSRRSAESRADFSFDKSFELLNIDIKLSFSARVSCKNFYTYKEIKVNDVKTTARVLLTIEKECEYLFAICNNYDRLSA